MLGALPSTNDEYIERHTLLSLSPSLSHTHTYTNTHTQNHTHEHTQVLLNLLTEDILGAPPSASDEYVDFDYIGSIVKDIRDWNGFNRCNATHCNILQHTATRCNTLQHTFVLERVRLPQRRSLLQVSCSGFFSCV